MRFIQVIDGADNCVFPVYSITDEDFAAIFPGEGQNIEFAQDLTERMGGQRAAGELIGRVTAAHVNKTSVRGIHGTLFIDLPKRKRFFPNKREDDVFVP